MTTILAIRATEGLDGIVLASDIQVSIYDEDKLYDRKKTGKKLLTGPNYALAYAGNMETPLYSFRNYLDKLKRADEKEMINKALRNYSNNPRHIRGCSFEPHFEELFKLNAAVISSTGDLDRTLKFILAVNDPELNFYEINEFGIVSKFVGKDLDRSFDYLALGSGSKKMEDYIEEQLNDEKIDPSNLTIKRILKLIKKCYSVIEKKDNDTLGPPDYAIITKDSIEVFGKDIRESMEDAYDNKLEEIGNAYEEKPKQEETKRPTTANPVQPEDKKS